MKGSSENTVSIKFLLLICYTRMHNPFSPCILYLHGKPVRPPFDHVFVNQSFMFEWNCCVHFCAPNSHFCSHLTSHVIVMYCHNSKTYLSVLFLFSCMLSDSQRRFKIKNQIRAKRHMVLN